MRTHATPSRRALLAGGAAAALMSPPALALPSTPDAELLALRPAWRSTLQAFKAALTDSAAAEGAGDDLLISSAQADDEATCAANMAIGEKIAALPATTLAGLRFKAEVSADQDHRDRDLIVSIMDDIAGLKEDRS